MSEPKYNATEHISIYNVSKCQNIFYLKLTYIQTLFSPYFMLWYSAQVLNGMNFCDLINYLTHTPIAS